MYGSVIIIVGDLFNLGPKFRRDGERERERYRQIERRGDGGRGKVGIYRQAWRRMPLNCIVF